MCCQSSGSFSVIWRGDAHLSHSSLNAELSELIVLKLFWPSSGTLQHHHQLTSIRRHQRANLCGRNFECACLITVNVRPTGKCISSLLSRYPYRNVYLLHFISSCRFKIYRKISYSDDHVRVMILWKKTGLFTVSKPRYITAVKPCRYNPRFFRTITVGH